MKYLINYADKRFRQAQAWNTGSAKFFGSFDKIFQFSPDQISSDFLSSHADIFAYERGNGLWLWKPYFFNKVLETCKDGDYVFYTDSGTFFIGKPDFIFKRVNEAFPMYCCDTPLIESCFTKPICFEEMNCKDVKYTDTNQIMATYFCVYVCDNIRKFAKEWLKLCCNLDLMKPEGCARGLTENKGKSFVSHREDQSIFSLLCKKYGFSPSEDISWHGTYYSPYYAYKEPIHSEKPKKVLFLHKSPTLGFSFFYKLFVTKIYKTVKRKRTAVYNCFLKNKN